MPTDGVYGMPTDARSEGEFATVFGAIFVAFVVEALIAVCLLVGVKTERRWFMVRVNQSTSTI